MIWERPTASSPPRRGTTSRSKWPSNSTAAHWTNVAYDSALRWWRSSRFLAERGMGVTSGVGLDMREELSLLSPDGEAPVFVTLERRWERVDGGALVAIVAHTGDPATPVITW